MKISNDALLNKYIDNAKRLHDAYVNDNNKKQDKYRGISSYIMNEIWKEPDCGESILLELIKNDNDSVRLGGATGLLSLNENLALSELQRISDFSDVSGIKFTAGILLDMWKKPDELLHFRNRKFQLG